MAVKLGPHHQSSEVSYFFTSQQQIQSAASLHLSSQGKIQSHSELLVLLHLSVLPLKLFIGSLQVFYDMFWPYLTSLQLFGNSMHLPYPPNWKVQEYLNSFTLKRNSLFFSQQLPIMCSTLLSTVGCWHGLVQSLYTLSQLLWVHMCSCPAVSRR